MMERSICRSGLFQPARGPGFKCAGGRVETCRSSRGKGEEKKNEAAVRDPVEKKTLIYCKLVETNPGEKKKKTREPKATS